MAATTGEIRRMANGSIVCEVTFAGVNRISTTVTPSAAAVARWINTTRQAYAPRAGSTQPQVVGLEVACDPNGNFALLQLCVGLRCLIYQLPHGDAGPPNELFAFLDDLQFCFVGAGVEALRTNHRFSVRNAVDLGQAAAMRLGQGDLQWARLERLTREVVALEMEKSTARLRGSAWWRRELSGEQIAYACTDAFVSFELGRTLLG